MDRQTVRALAVLAGVGGEVGCGDPGDRAGLVLVRYVARDPDGADDRAAGAVADQDTTGCGNDAPIRHGVERREERLLLRLLGHAPSERARTGAHPERAPGLAHGYLRPDDAGAVLAGERLQMSAGVQDRDRQRRAAGLTALPERGFDDRGGLREAQIGHGRSSEFEMPSIVCRAVGRRAGAAGRARARATIATFSTPSLDTARKKEPSMKLAIGIVALVVALAIGASPAAAQGKSDLTVALSSFSTEVLDPVLGGHVVKYYMSLMLD